MRQATWIVLLGFLIFSPSPGAGAQSWIWWEGEDAHETNFPRSTWFSTGAIQSSRHLLSGGAWLTNEGERRGDAAFAKYRVEIPEAGDYDFWARKFWKHGPFRWRFGGEWQTVGPDISLADSVGLAEHVVANWVHAGRAELGAGTAELEIELLAGPGESLTAAFDCFLLTAVPFVPRGKLKPEETSGLADEGFFPWEPGPDPFSDAAALDLRFLNEDEAGQSGPIRREGNGFALGNGEPVRLWGVNVSSEIAGLSRPSVEYLAKKLAKSGVNAVRYHSALFVPGDPDSVDLDKLDDLHFLVSALKNEGIYTAVSFYFPLWFNVRPHYGIPGFDTIQNDKPFALLFFNERMQEIHRGWMRTLLTETNPYTGAPLKDEPALAMMEIQNEDSFFFWTFTKQNVPAVHWTQLEGMFAEWLTERHGSVSAAFESWGNVRENGDNPAEGRVALYEAWHMTGGAINQAGAAKRKRVGDQVRFLTGLQRGYYGETARYAKEELGAQCLIAAGNWHTADPAMLDALERYTYAAGDVMDHHGYFGGPHNSDDGSHSYDVREGHTFENRSALRDPEGLPIQTLQTEGFPHIISEIGWTNPNLYRADFCAVAAACGALQGVDGLFPFAVGGAFWDTEMKKFALNTPVILGNFPAFALLYRQGYIEEGPAVIHQVLDMEDLYAMKVSGGSAAQAFDEFRAADVPPGALAEREVDAIDPLAFYAGRVARTLGGDPAESTEMNLAGLVDRESRFVAAATGQLRWNYGNGVLEIGAPAAKGAAGFLRGRGPVELEGAVIECGNEYASVIAVSLDGKPLRESGKILVQCVTVERPHGFRATEGQEGRITEPGSYPYGVEKIDAAVTLELDGSREVRATALDGNGYPREVSPRMEWDGNRLRIDLVEDSIYHVIERNGESGIGMIPRHP